MDGDWKDPGSTRESSKGCGRRGGRPSEKAAAFVSDTAVGKLSDPPALTGVNRVQPLIKHTHFLRPVRKI